MCCERLVCASCTGPVAEARCGVCRASRARVHAGPQLPRAAVQAALLVVLAVLLLAVLTGQ